MEIKWCSEPVINVIPKVGTVRYQLQDCIAKIWLVLRGVTDATIVSYGRKGLASPLEPRKIFSNFLETLEETLSWGKKLKGAFFPL